MAEAVICPLWLLSAGLTPGALRVYLAIAAHQGKRREAWPSQARIAALCALSVDQVRRAVAELVTARLLARKPLHGCRQLTYVVLVPADKAPPTPCMVARQTPAPMQGEESKRSLEKTDAPSRPRETRGRQRREKSRPPSEVLQYIADVVEVKTARGEMQIGAYAYAQALRKRWLEGRLDLSTAAYYRAEALKLDESRKAAIKGKPNGQEGLHRD